MDVSDTKFLRLSLESKSWLVNFWPLASANYDGALTDETKKKIITLAFPLESNCSFIFMPVFWLGLETVRTDRERNYYFRCFLTKNFEAINFFFFIINLLGSLLPTKKNTSFPHRRFLACNAPITPVSLSFSDFIRKDGHADRGPGKLTSLETITTIKHPLRRPKKGKKDVEHTRARHHNVGPYCGV